MRRLSTFITAGAVIILIIFVIPALSHRKHVRAVSAAWNEHLIMAKTDVPLFMHGQLTHSELDVLSEAHGKVREQGSGNQPDPEVVEPPDQREYERLLLKEMTTIFRSTGRAGEAKAFSDASEMMDLGKPDPNPDLRELKRKIDEIDMTVPATTRPSTRP
jgi:hypothetical protein